MKEPINYHIKASSDVDYNLTLEMKADGKLLKTALDKSKIALKRKKNLNVKGDLDAINAFELDARFYGVVKTFLKKTFNLIFDATKKDGVILLSYEVEKGLFKRDDGENWKVILTLKGRYTQNEN